MLLCVGENNFFDELAEGSLESPVVVLVVRTMIAGAKPCRLGVRNLADGTWLAKRDLRGLPLEDANLETRILRALENFLSVKAVEGFRCIFTGCDLSSAEVWSW